MRVRRYIPDHTCNFQQQIFIELEGLTHWISRTEQLSGKGFTQDHLARAVEGLVTSASEFETEVDRLKLTLRKERDIRSNSDYILVYLVIGREKNLDEINNFLKRSTKVVSYEY